MCTLEAEMKLLEEKKMSEVLELLNEIETSLQTDIEAAVEFYGDKTDDAEMYIGQLQEKAQKEIDELLAQYDPENEIFWFDGEKWVLK